MFSRFFIDRPIFASVLSIVITLAGAVSVFSLPLAQFPRVSPPLVSVTCTYPGASARDVAEAVAAPIEQQVNGVEGMLYMSSSCTNDGVYSLSVTFNQSVDVDMAQVLVQNRVALAVPTLPDVIKQTGVTVRKRSPDPLMGFAIVSPQGRYDQLYLSNYTLRYIRDELLRVEGVTDIVMLGQRDYSIRIWVNPNRLAARGLTPAELVQAIREQNDDLASGQIGQPPGVGSADFQITIDLQGRLTEPEDFEQIIVKSTPDGRVVRLRDVGRVELGSRSQEVDCRFDRMSTAFLIIFQSPDANALDTRDRILTKMAELKKNFPEDLSSDISFDTTPYTSESIREVFKTLRDAILLVAAVVLLFLQNWRSALIPLVAVPVAIVGTFAAMAACGYSLNNLTLFGLVLAIGIVVDDAIVVVEAVEHHIEAGLSPRDATIKAMDQVSGPVIAVGLVLSAVFVPCMFIAGITGMFFQQFALTIAVSTLLSCFNSLTLSPALAAFLLRPRGAQAAPPLPRIAFPVAGAWLAWEFLTPPLAVWLPGETARLAAALLIGAVAGWLLSRPLNATLGWLFRAFDRLFKRITVGYTKVVGVVLRTSLLILLIYAGLLGLTYLGFRHTAKGFIPPQDIGYLLVSVQLPDSASKERTNAVLHQVEDICIGSPGIRHATSISGQSFVLSANGSNFGSMFLNLKDYADRRDPSLHCENIAARLRAEITARVFDGNVAIFTPPPLRGVGRAGGFTFVLEDRGDLGPVALQQQVENLVRKGNETPGLTGLFAAFRANVPQLKIEPDKRQCMTRGISLRDFSDTLRIYEGSLYINDFNQFDRTWQVIVQADYGFRDQVSDLKRLKIRNREGQMVQVGSVADVREVNGPLVLTRYNMYPAATINGAAAPGYSSRQAIDLMRELADRELPGAMATEWTDLSYLELAAGNTGLALFALGSAMVFLVLAAQYESWSLPLAVILVVPMCLLSAIAGVFAARMNINVFTQIGFVVLIGLASKNAILIVEFARSLREQGIDRREATLTACRLRLRPIIMTSLAFVLGVTPLVLAHGAGHEMRRALGTAVFSGMIGVTLFGIFFTPVFFYVIDWLGETRLFASRWMQRFGEMSLQLLTLRGMFRFGQRLLFRGATRKQSPGERRA
ncbi:MAG: multidrug efflux RND transporter permease subunit [Planctomycetia bacterium]|nr:multidrug efflux RND transporter permease subunit [Planctomycetia bacterium]